MVGSTKLFQSCRPEGGTHPRYTAKKKMNMMPSQKDGAACPIKATALPNLVQNAASQNRRHHAEGYPDQEREQEGSPTKLERRRDLFRDYLQARVDAG